MVFDYIVVNTDRHLTRNNYAVGGCTGKKCGAPLPTEQQHKGPPALIYLDQGSSFYTGRGNDKNPLIDTVDKEVLRVVFCVGVCAGLHCCVTGVVWCGVVWCGVGWGGVGWGGVGWGGVGGVGWGGGGGGGGGAPAAVPRTVSLGVVPRGSHADQPRESSVLPLLEQDESRRTPENAPPSRPSGSQRRCTTTLRSDLLSSPGHRPL